MSGGQSSAASHGQKAGYPSLGLILALALVHGLLYLAVMPPWQHYDEPTHFEYVRLLAERGRLPLPDDYDLAMRREIAASMQATGFWAEGAHPILDLWSDTPPAIGISELGHPPLYYLLLALPQRLVRYQDVLTQLYLARLGSVLLYVITIAAVWGLAAELFPRRRGMAAAAALFALYVPAVADVLSGVNNDAGATAAASLFLWSAVSLLRRGASPWRLAAVLISAAACLVTKSTSAALALAGLLVLVAGRLWPAGRRWPWAVTALLLAGLLAATLTWGQHAAGWYDLDRSDRPQRRQMSAAEGSFAFALSAEGEDSVRGLFQELPRMAGAPLAGQVVTLGAWLRAADGQSGQVALGLWDGSGQHLQSIPVDDTWAFHTITATVAAGSPTVAAMVALPPVERMAPAAFADGLVLVAGAPALDGQGPVAGNLLRNASAERGWPGLRTGLRGVAVYRTAATLVMHSALDWPRTAGLYGPELRTLLHSFWGRFGWGHVLLPAGWLPLLGGIVVVGLAGAGWGLKRRWKEMTVWQRRAAWLLGVALAVAWASTLLRIHPVFVIDHIFWPAARYGLVALAPLSVVLVAGLAELVPARLQPAAALAGLLALVTLDLVALWLVIVPYYYG